MLSHRLLLLLVVVFGVLNIGIEWLYLVGPYGFIVLWLTVVFCRMAAFALIYWRIEKHIRDGGGKINAILYLIVSSLVIAFFPLIIDLFRRTEDFGLVGLIREPGFETSIVGRLKVVFMSPWVFIAGTILGIILIFLTKHTTPFDKGSTPN